MTLDEQQPASYQHLLSMTTHIGLYEHALGDQPRLDHAYCVDDAARALIVTTRESQPAPPINNAVHIYLAFLEAAITPSGLIHNRRDLDGNWTDRASTDDHWGRAIWALGTAAATSLDLIVSSQSFIAATTLMQQRSPWPRSMAYSALGAAQILLIDPHHEPALSLVNDVKELLPHTRNDTFWPWPEDRLTYANAVIPQAMIAIATVQRNDSLMRDGLQLLRWLVNTQLLNGQLSLVSSQGFSRGSTPPAFAQQPIEAACLAEACAQAFDATADPYWLSVIELCLRWFNGANDLGEPVCIPSTGAGLDGLENDRVSLNQGAESTLAYLSTVQLFRTYNDQATHMNPDDRILSVTAS